MRRSPEARAAVVLLLAGILLEGGAAASLASSGVRSNIPYASPGGYPLLLDAYIPPGNGPFPGVVLLHAGGWKSGSRGDMAKMAVLLSQQGFDAFTVDYRLSVPFPAAFHDVQAAVRYLRAHANQFSLNGAEIGAVGFSAGGELAALLGTVGSGPLDRGSRVAAVATWSGPMDLEALLRSGNPQILSLVMPYLNCGSPTTCLPQAKAASPVDHVDASDAPMFLVNSSNEIMPLGQAQGMSKALTADHVLAQVQVEPGDQHVPITPTSIDEAIGFLQKELGGSTGSGPTGAGLSGGTTRLLAPGSKDLRRSSLYLPGLMFIALGLAGLIGYGLSDRLRHHSQSK